jgi:hypothetical protein
VRLIRRWNVKLSSPAAGFAAIFALWAPCNAAALESLTPYQAEYKVKILVLSGKLFAEVRATDDGFMARSVVQASGIARLFVSGTIEESAWFGTGDQGVVPDKYQSVDQISSDPKVMNFQFDWDQSRVTGTINDEEHVIELEGLVHDRVSIQYELMLDLLNNEPSTNYILLNEDELRPIFVTNIGEKDIKVPYGTFRAVGIQHSNKEKSRVTVLWCVEELGYLPVLIEQYNDGKRRVRAELKHYTPIQETAATSGK